MGGSLCVSTHPLPSSSFAHTYLRLIDESWLPFTMPPTPLEWTSQGPSSPILWLIALLLHGKSPPKIICEEMNWLLCLNILTYEQHHVVK